MDPRSLPGDVVDALVRALGAYVRAVLKSELPGTLRPLQGFRPKALAAHAPTLLDALEDDALRDAVATWLEEMKPRLDERAKSALRLATVRPEGWEEELVALATPDEETAPRTPGSDPEARAADLEARLARERDKAKKARADVRRARDEARSEVDAERARADDLVARLEEAKARIEELEVARARAEAARDAAATDADRGVRKARREAEEMRSERDEAKRELRGARRAAQEETRRADRLAGRVSALEAQLERTAAREEPPEEREAPARRRPLPVPRGRFDDDPQTLDEWLSVPGVQVLVDGYNVTKAEGGFGGLGLEAQRDRLLAGLLPIVQRKGVAATVVFDGTDVDTAARRKFRGPIAVEYSSAGEIADDHLIALLERLPPPPVIVVTNDRELQDRARSLGATVATSTQLLALIR